MSQLYDRFRIPAAAKPAALAALKVAFPHEDDVRRAEDLEGALAKLRWECESEGFCRQGDVVEIHFSGDVLRSDKMIFDAIAPFVEAGSYVEMMGDDGQMWRWVFDGHNCVEVHPTVTWPPLPTPGEGSKAVPPEDPRQLTVYEVAIYPQPILSYWVRTTSPSRAWQVAVDTYRQEAHSIDCGDSAFESDIYPALKDDYPEIEVIEDPDVEDEGDA